MKISNDTIEFEDSGWTVSSTSDNRIKVEHDNGEVYYFNDVGELEASSINVKSVNTGDARIGNSWSDKDPQTAAPLVADDDVTIHVSPSGDDSNDGTQSNPVQTTHEALSRIPKINYRYDMRVYLDYGDYSNDQFRLFNHWMHPQGTTLKVVGHDTSNPFYNSSNSVSDVVVNYIVGAGNAGTEEIIIDGIEIDGWVQHKHDVVKYNNCNFTTGGGDENRALGLKKCHMVLDNCNISNVGQAFNLNEGQLSLRNCTFSSITNEPFEVQNGGVVKFIDSENPRNVAGQDAHVDGIVLSNGGDAPMMEANQDGVRWVMNTRLDTKAGMRMEGSSVNSREVDIDWRTASGTRHTRFNNNGTALYVQEQAILHDEGVVLDRGESDLSGETGDNNGHIRLNDGTTGNNEMYWWDESSNVWRAFSDRTSTISPS